MAAILLLEAEALQSAYINQVFTEEVIRKWPNWLPRRGNSTHDRFKDWRVPLIPLHGRLSCNVGEI
jgi:hypothetical protein